MAEMPVLQEQKPAVAATLRAIGGRCQKSLRAIFCCRHLIAMDGGNAGFAGAKTGRGGNPSGHQQVMSKTAPGGFLLSARLARRRGGRWTGAAAGIAAATAAKFVSLDTVLLNSSSHGKRKVFLRKSCVIPYKNCADFRNWG